MALAVPIEEIVKDNEFGLLSRKLSWKRINLGDIAKIINGYAFKSKNFVKNKNKGTPIIRIRDIHNTETEVNYVGEFDNNYLVNKGDILVGMDGDFEVSIWKGDASLLNQRVCKVIVDENNFNKKFFYYVLPGYLEAINKHTSSVTVKHLSSKTLLDTPLPNPNLNEQKLIVQEIEKQFSRLDESVKSLKDLKRKLKVYRKSVLKAAFEGKLILAADWVDSNIKQEVKIRYGKGLPEKTRIAGSIPVYASAGRVGSHNQALIDFDTIIVARKGSIGNNFIVKEPCWPIDTVFYLDEIQLDINYLFHFLNFSIFKDTSTAVPSLRRPDLEAIKIRYPKSREHQKQIVQKIESRFSVIDKLEQTVNLSLEKAERLRKSILKSAFEGKLVKI